MSDEKKDALATKITVGDMLECPIPERKRGEEGYANIVNVHSSIYDVRLDFGQRAVPPDSKHRMDTTIYMSPQHAKDLLVVLLRVISEYEKSFGMIPSEYEVLAEVRKKERGSLPALPITKFNGVQ